MDIPDWLAESGPQVPLETLVEEVNKIFHSFGAAGYDRDHPEIYEQLPPIWTEMIAQLPNPSCLNVVDLGCGTGFEASLLLNGLSNHVFRLTAYDPSPEMIAICKNRLKMYPQVFFCSRIEEVRSHGPFNLLLTNSLLHHLPNIVDTLGSLLPSLSDNAVWLAGHEPSVRFYRNDACLQLLQSYRRSRKFARWFVLDNYAAGVRLLLGRDPLSATADSAYERGLFSKRPSSTVIDRIVDFHVPHSAEDVSGGGGLDIERMQTWFERDWTLEWSKTYSFLGPFPYVKTPRKWLNKARGLERQYPSDGANFCMVWRRKPGSNQAQSPERQMVDRCM